MYLNPTAPTQREHTPQKTSTRRRPAAETNTTAAAYDVHKHRTSTAAGTRRHAASCCGTSPDNTSYHAASRCGTSPDNTSYHAPLADESTVVPHRCLPVSLARQRQHGLSAATARHMARHDMTSHATLQVQSYTDRREGVQSYGTYVASLYMNKVCAGSPTVTSLKNSKTAAAFVSHGRPFNRTMWSVATVHTAQ
jgi:hypothetical protein